MKKAVLILGALITSCMVHAAKVTSFDSQQPLIYPITLSNTAYVRGTITTQQPFSQAMLLDQKGQLVKHLADAGNQLRLYLKPEKTGQYVIKLLTENDNTATINLEPAVPQPAKAEPKSLLSARLKQLQQQLREGSNSDEFWREMTATGTPLVEYQNDKEAVVTFLWRGDQYNVQLYGAPFGSHQNLQRLEQSDVWYKSYTLPTDTVMAYQLAPDVPVVPGKERASRIAILATKQTDPLNKSPWLVKHQDKYNVQSTLVLKDAKLILDTVPSEDSKRVTYHDFASKLLGNSRKLGLYRHPKASANSPLLIFFDGEAYLSKVPSVKIIEQLVAKNSIPPANALFIYNASRKSRGIELPANETFAKAMAEEIQPWLINQGLEPTAKNIALIGSSYGGLAATYVAFSYPERFGKVLSQSGSFWWSPRTGTAEQTEPQWLTRLIAKSPSKDIQLYLNAGKFETGYFTIDILESNRHMRDVLSAKNYQYQYHEFSGGHDYFAWRNELAAGLQALFAN